MDNSELLKLYRTFYVLGDSTCLKILFELERYGERNFTQLRNKLEINPATLSKKLKLLTQFDLIVPDKSHDQLRVFYQLHEHKRAVKRVLDAVERLSIEL